LAYFCRRKHLCVFNHFYIISPESYRTQRLGLLGRSRSFKVTEFGTNRNLICDFLLVINSNLYHILHRFRDKPLIGPKSLYLAICPFCV